MRKVYASLLVSLGALVLGMASVLPAEAAQPSGPAGASSTPGSALESSPTAGEAVISVDSTIYHAGSWDRLPGTVFRIGVSGGVPASERVTTTEDSGATFTVTVEGSVAAVRITETVLSGLKLHKAGCAVLDSISGEGPEPVAHTLDGTTLTLEVEAGREYSCDFVTGAPRQPGAIVLITAYMDADGALDSTSDTSLGVGRQLRVSVTNGRANHAVVTTDRRGAALINVSAFGRVAITEVDQADFLYAFCSDVLGEGSAWNDDGPTAEWDVDPGGVYACEFWNRGIGADGEPIDPLSLLPRTDAVGAPSPSRPGGVPLFLVLIAAGSLGFVTSMRRSRRQLGAQQQ